MADKVRVFTEADVRAVVADYELRTRERTVFTQHLEAAIRDHEGELTEEVVARSHADRLVVFALVWGAWDCSGVPQAAWDELLREGYVELQGGEPVEAWPTVTPKGVAWFEEQMEAGR